jgi:molecular chaperone GrpE
MGNEREDAEARGNGGQQPQSSEVEDAGGPATDREREGPQGQPEEQAKADRYLVNWQRAEADLANFKRRAEQERADLVKFANSSLIGKLLPILDDFGRALDTVPPSERSSGWAEGIQLIERKLQTVLEQEGVAPIEALGKEFDPHVHEAVMREDGEGDTDMVVEEFQRGYRLHGRVIRPAMVKVGRRSSTFTNNNSKSKE